MKHIFIGVFMVVAVLANLFFCFWVGDSFISSGEWFVVPGVITLFIWFFGLALFFAAIADKYLG
tara:strand:- start:3186 stop:3377 length:192 start_codon:yes stop_codon:yes gene_type:complete